MWYRIVDWLWPDLRSKIARLMASTENTEKRLDVIDQRIEKLKSKMDRLYDQDWSYRDHVLSPNALRKAMREILDPPREDYDDDE